MKHTNLLTYLLLCIIVCTHYSSDALYGDSTHAANQFSPSSTQVSIHASAIAGAGAIFGIVLALISPAYGLYRWWQSDDVQIVDAQENAQQQSQSIHFSSDDLDRHKAAFALHAGMHDVITQSYALDDQTRGFLHMHKLDDKHYTHCTGNILEHALHAECVSLAHDTAHLHIPQIINNYRATLAHAIDVGRACVHGHDITHAVVVIDWAHSLYRYLAAAIKGVGDGLEETVQTFVHPYRTCKQLIGSAHEVVRCTMRMFYELGLIETLIDRDNDVFIEAYLSDRGRIIYAAVAGIKKQIASLSGPDTVQKTVAAATQAMLTGKCLGVLLSFFTHAANQVQHTINRASNILAQEEYALALAVDNCAVSIAQEAAQLSLFAADKHIPSSTLIGAVGAYKPLADELEHLRKMFASYLLDKDRTLIHVFEGELNKVGELGGLHHDYLGYLEVQGKIRVLETLPNGMYRAQVLFNGQWETKSFFPKHWTREKVLQEVVHTIRQFPDSAIITSKKGNCAIEAIIAGQKCIIVLNSHRKIITAYPTLPRVR